MDNTVFIVDDDPSVRDALGLLLGLHGFRTAFYADAASFLGAWRADWCGCLVIDIRMPGMDGLTLQRRLRDEGCTIPVIIVTGHGDVASACEAFRAEAIDFLEKPIDEARLVAAITAAFARQAETRNDLAHKERTARRLAVLTPREREVMELVVAGRHNRAIADALGISVRTVEVHKARMLAKLGVDGVPQLVRLSLGLTEAE
jgi:FixJ family two-component response regulator